MQADIILKDWTLGKERLKYYIEFIREWAQHTVPPVAAFVALSHLSCSRLVGASLHFGDAGPLACKSVH